MVPQVTRCLTNELVIVVLGSQLPSAGRLQLIAFTSNKFFCYLLHIFSAVDLTLADVFVNNTAVEKSHIKYIAKCKYIVPLTEYNRAI